MNPAQQFDPHTSNVIYDYQIGFSNLTHIIGGKGNSLGNILSAKEELHERGLDYEVPRSANLTAITVKRVLENSYVSRDNVNGLGEIYGGEEGFLYQTINDLFDESGDDSSVSISEFAHTLVDSLKRNYAGTPVEEQEHYLEETSRLIRGSIEDIDLNNFEDVVNDVSKAYDWLRANSYEDKLDSNGDPLIALRSSALGEDGDDNAFAGLQDTFLNVSGLDNVLRYTLDCISSAYTKESMIYRINDPDAVEEDNFYVDVVMMNMVEADTSGVTFTRPQSTSIPGFTETTAVHGLGVNVVEGTGVDRYLVNTSTLNNPELSSVIDRKIRFKSKRYQYDGGLGENVNLEAGDPNYTTTDAWKPTLSDDEAEYVAKVVKGIGQVIDKHFPGKSPMGSDNEWAYKGNTLHMVQRRPLTVKTTRYSFLERERIDEAVLEEYIAEKGMVLVAEGTAASPGVAQSQRISYVTKDNLADFTGGHLVSEMTTPDFLAKMLLAKDTNGAVITVYGGELAHATITSRENGIVCITDVANAIEYAQSVGPDMFTIADGNTGKIYSLDSKFAHDLANGVAIPTEKTDISPLIPYIESSRRTKLKVIAANESEAMNVARINRELDLEGSNTLENRLTIGLARAETALNLHGSEFTGALGIHPTFALYIDNFKQITDTKYDKLTKEQLDILDILYNKLTGDEQKSLVISAEDKLSSHEHNRAIWEQTTLTHLLSSAEDTEIYAHLKAFGRVGPDELTLERARGIAESQVSEYGRIIESSAADYAKILTEFTDMNGEITRPTLLKELYLDLKETVDRASQITEVLPYESIVEYWVDMHSRAIATLAQGFSKNEKMIYRTMDLRSGEFRKMWGAKYVEAFVENDMITRRGEVRSRMGDYTLNQVLSSDDPHNNGFLKHLTQRNEFRSASEMEYIAIRRAIDHYGTSNLEVMIPFIRTGEGLGKVLDIMRQYKLTREFGVENVAMFELPANFNEPSEFILKNYLSTLNQLVDEFAKMQGIPVIGGISFGTNDGDQMVFARYREDSEIVKWGTGDAMMPALLGGIIRSIEEIHKYGGFASICGQKPSNDPKFLEALVRAGIDSISVSVDSIGEAAKTIADVEKGLYTGEAGEELLRQQRLQSEHDKLKYPQLETLPDVEFAGMQNALTVDDVKEGRLEAWIQPN